jgi:hypothetical protein
MARTEIKFLRSFKGLMLIVKVDGRPRLIIVIGCESLEAANEPASCLNCDGRECNFCPAIMVDRQTRFLGCTHSRTVATRETGHTG